MSDINERLKRLELAFEVNKKEPTTLEEFLEQYLDYEELDKYFSDTFDKAIKEKEAGGGDYFEAVREVEKALEEDSKYLNDKRLQRARKCFDYYFKLHPKGIQEKIELDKIRNRGKEE